MSDINPNIQRISFEEIQEFKDLDLFKLTWEQTNGRRVLLAYDPKSHTFGYSYAEPGTDGGDQNISIFYGHSALIANFLDSDDLSARPSINGFDNGDGIIAMSTVGSVKKFDFYDVEISLEHGIDRYVYRTSLMQTVYSQPEDGHTPVKGVDYFDGVDGITPVKGVDYFDGYTPVKGVDYFDGAPAVTNLQKVLVYPADFTGINYVLKNSDNNHELIIDNGTTDVTITVPSGLSSKIGFGFTQKGLGNVLYIASGTTIRNPTGLFIKGQYFQTYLSQEGLTDIYYLGGDTKATGAAEQVPVFTLNYFTDGCFGFTATGPAQGALTMQRSTDNGATWVSNTGSAVSPRCGFPEPVVTTKYRVASTTDPIVYSNIVERVISFNSVMFSYAANGTDVCAAASIERRLQQLPFTANSVIYNTDNSSLSMAGWYSDGSNKAYWDGTALSQFGPCSAPVAPTTTYSFDGQCGTGVPTKSKFGSDTSLNDACLFSLVITGGPVTFETSTALNSGSSMSATFSIDGVGNSTNSDTTANSITNYGAPITLQPGSYTGTFSYNYTNSQGLATVRITTS